MQTIHEFLNEIYQAIFDTHTTIYDAEFGVWKCVNCGVVGKVTLSLYVCTDDKNKINSR